MLAWAKRYFICMLVMGRPAGAATGADGTDAYSHLLQLAGGLILVIGMILLLSWLLRRFQGGRLVRQAPVRVLGGTAVGQRERVVLIQVGKQQLLLGVGGGNVRTLQVFGQPIIPDPLESVGHEERNRS